MTLENNKESRKSRKPNFKMGVSPRAVDWLTLEVSRGSRKSRSKFSKMYMPKMAVDWLTWFFL